MDLMSVTNYDPSQPRDDAGRWSIGTTHSIPVGTFGVPRNIVWDTDEEEAHDIARKVLGPGAQAHDLLATAGVLDGSVVSVQRMGSATFVHSQGTAVIKDPLSGEITQQPFAAKRTLYLSSSGKYVKNDEFVGRGSGLVMFARQVENAARWGFTRIETTADGSGSGVPGKRPAKSNKNGYYTWPRFGYDGQVDTEALPAMPDSLKVDLASAGNKVSGLLKSQEGRDWWLGHGHPLDATFDLAPNSYSQQTLVSYLRQRGKLGGTDHG